MQHPSMLYAWQVVYESYKARGIPMPKIYLGQKDYDRIQHEIAQEVSEFSTVGGISYPRRHFSLFGIEFYPSDLGVE